MIATIVAAMRRRSTASIAPRLRHLDAEQQRWDLEQLADVAASRSLSRKRRSAGARRARG